MVRLTQLFSTHLPFLFQTWIFDKCPPATTPSTCYLQPLASSPIPPHPNSHPCILHQCRNTPFFTFPFGAYFVFMRTYPRHLPFLQAHHQSMLLQDNLPSIQCFLQVFATPLLLPCPDLLPIAVPRNLFYDYNVLLISSIATQCRASDLRPNVMFSCFDIPRSNHETTPMCSLSIILTSTSDTPSQCNVITISLDIV